jgi:hypothetical protein
VNTFVQSWQISSQRFQKQRQNWTQSGLDYNNRIMFVLVVAAAILLLRMYVDILIARINTADHSIDV